MFRTETIVVSGRGWSPLRTGFSKGYGYKPNPSPDTVSGPVTPRSLSDDPSNRTRMFSFAYTLLLGKVKGQRHKYFYNVSLEDFSSVLFSVDVLS